MSEDESRRGIADEAADEVEAHSRRSANDEPAAEETDGDDVEAHARRSAPGEESARGT
jgi:hypothetical protein